MNGQFWMVWNPNGNQPRVRHSSASAAVDEAERLARENPGERFYVLEATDLRHVDDMRRVDLRLGAVEPDDRSSHH